jgi:hypothetical protein
MLKIAVLLAAAALVAFAADVSGTWKGSMETPMGSMESTFVLKADGVKLTGTVQGGPGPGGDMKIEEGKIDGDKVSFSVSMEFGKITYSGTFTADELKLKMAVGGGPGGGGPGGDMPPMEINCKRAK